MSGALSTCIINYFSFPRIVFPGEEERGETRKTSRERVSPFFSMLDGFGIQKRFVGMAGVVSLSTGTSRQ